MASHLWSSSLYDVETCLDRGGCGLLIIVELHGIFWRTSVHGFHRKSASPYLSEYRFHLFATQNPKQYLRLSFMLRLLSFTPTPSNFTCFDIELGLFKSAFDFVLAFILHNFFDFF